MSSDTYSDHVVNHFDINKVRHLFGVSTPQTVPVTVLLAPLGLLTLVSPRTQFRNV